MSATETHAENLRAYGLAVEYLPVGNWSTKAVSAARGRLYRAAAKAGVRAVVSSTGAGLCTITATVINPPCEVTE